MATIDPTCACCSSGSSRTASTDKSTLHREEANASPSTAGMAAGRRHSGVVDNDAQRDGHGRRPEDLEEERVVFMSKSLEGSVAAAPSQDDVDAKLSEAALKHLRRPKKAAAPDGGRPRSVGPHDRGLPRPGHRAGRTAQRPRSPVKLLKWEWMEKRADELRAATTDEERRALALPRRQDLERDEPDAFTAEEVGRTDDQQSLGYTLSIVSVSHAWNVGPSDAAPTCSSSWTRSRGRRRRKRRRRSGGAWPPAPWRYSSTTALFPTRSEAVRGERAPRRRRRAKARRVRRRSQANCLLRRRGLR